MILSCNIFQKFNNNVALASSGRQKSENLPKKIVGQDAFVRSNRISFKSVETPEKINIAGFSIYDINKVQELVDKTKYGVDIKAILNDNRYSIVALTNKIELTNFIAPTNSSDSTIGRCDELSYKVGKQLETMFGKEYKFCTACNDNHTYLAAWHKDNDEAILDFIHKTNSFYSNNDKFSLKGYNLFEHLPQEMLIIDPSYKKVGISSDKKFAGFSLLYFQTLKDANPYKVKHNIIARYHPYSSNLTIGSVGSLFDKEYKEKFPNKGLVTIEFFKVKQENKLVNVDIKVRLSDYSGLNSFFCTDDDLEKHSPLIFQLVSDMRKKMKLSF